ncbi:FG-GAP-like repeat-containing protein [Caulobacter sp. 1776]|uniref:FG-GAP-like repeat-containing protein n=1 Tax=Caulobacter sp. 1776 TaxID=3156420 RepID=UPI00339A95FE
MATKFQTQDLSFALRAGFTAASVHEIAVADFNGDGKLDVALSYFLYPLEDRAVPIRVLTGDGAGGFTDSTDALFAGQPPVTVHGRQIVVADFNKDGRADAFFADHGYDAAPFPGARNALFLSSGATGLVNATSRLPSLADYSHSAAAGDIDGDGDLDLYVGNYNGGTEEAPYFLVNDGSANFTLSRAGLPADIVAGQYNSPASVLFDADGDGDLDLLLTPNETQTQTARLLKNDGKGNFSALSAFAMPKNGATETVIDAKAADLNGDGKLDLVLTTVVDLFKPGSTQVWINDGQGGFANETAKRLPVQATEDWYTRTQLIDINGDGHVDLVASNSHKQAVFLNDGAGRFVQLPEGWLNVSQYDRLQAADVNGDGRTDVIAWRGVWDGAEHITVHLAADAGTTANGGASADALVGDAQNETLNGLAGNDVLFGGAGDDALNGGDGADILVGGAGADRIDGGTGVDEARYGGLASDYAIGVGASGWTVTDTRANPRDGADTLINVESLLFADKSMALGDATVGLAVASLLRASAAAGAGGVLTADLTAKISAGAMTQAGAIAEVVKAADQTTSVATLSYLFFTGKIPGQPGVDYLVSATGPNPNNLNSAYYQSFNFENRYINFAVNLGKVGEGAAKFTTDYGALSLFDATKKAYAAIFGGTPTDAKVHALVDTRVDYFASYGGDGPNGLGTKAAMVGWLLAEAEKADVGVMARSNAAWLTDLADGSAPFAIDILDPAKGYYKADFVFGGG